ncbi:MAG: hypothetical protein M1834_005278 [Cirrosporium novae-zelandiae]|nr:MAG: hypothetical protein M1834_005278 [Cirrosporium novae-zelandiae]
MQTGCKVTMLTLNEEQKAHVETMIGDTFYSSRIKVMLCDYRDLPIPPPNELFDKVVSIEMLEAVGREHLRTYFGRVNCLLKPDGGIAVFQCITFPESRYEEYSNGHNLIQDHIRIALTEKHDDMTEEEIQVFRRKFEVSDILGFEERVLGDHIVTVAREGAAEMMQGFPKS